MVNRNPPPLIEVGGNNPNGFTIPDTITGLGRGFTVAALLWLEEQFADFDMSSLEVLERPTDGSLPWIPAFEQCPGHELIILETLMKAWTPEEFELRYPGPMVLFKQRFVMSEEEWALKRDSFRKNILGRIKKTKDRVDGQFRIHYAPTAGFQDEVQHFLLYLNHAELPVDVDDYTGTDLVYEHNRPSMAHYLRIGDGYHEPNELQQQRQRLEQKGERQRLEREREEQQRQRQQELQRLRRGQRVLQNMQQYQLNHSLSPTARPARRVLAEITNRARNLQPLRTTRKNRRRSPRPSGSGGASEAENVPSVQRDASASSSNHNSNSNISSSRSNSSRNDDDDDDADNLVFGNEDDDDDAGNLPFGNDDDDDDGVGNDPFDHDTDDEQQQQQDGGTEDGRGIVSPTRSEDAPFVRDDAVPPPFWLEYKQQRQRQQERHNSEDSSADDHDNRNTDDGTPGNNNLNGVGRNRRFFPEDEPSIDPAFNGNDDVDENGGGRHNTAGSPRSPIAKAIDATINKLNPGRKLLEEKKEQCTRLMEYAGKLHEKLCDLRDVSYCAIMAKDNELETQRERKDKQISYLQTDKKRHIKHIKDTHESTIRLYVIIGIICCLYCGSLGYSYGSNQEVSYTMNVVRETDHTELELDLFGFEDVEDHGGVTMSPKTKPGLSEREVDDSVPLLQPQPQAGQSNVLPAPQPGNSIKYVPNDDATPSNADRTWMSDLPGLHGGFSVSNASVFGPNNSFVAGPRTQSDSNKSSNAVPNFRPNHDSDDDGDDLEEEVGSDLEPNIDEAMVLFNTDLSEEDSLIPQALQSRDDVYDSKAPTGFGPTGVPFAPRLQQQRQQQEQEQDDGGYGVPLCVLGLVVLIFLAYRRLSNQGTQQGADDNNQQQQQPPLNRLAMSETSNNTTQNDTIASPTSMRGLPPLIVDEVPFAPELNDGSKEVVEYRDVLESNGSGSHGSSLVPTGLHAATGSTGNEVRFQAEEEVDVPSEVAVVFSPGAASRVSFFHSPDTMVRQCRAREETPSPTSAGHSNTRHREHSRVVSTNDGMSRITNFSSAATAVNKRTSKLKKPKFIRKFFKKSPRSGGNS